MSLIPINPDATPFDAIRRVDATGEYWSARDLMAPLGYQKWERFEDAIDRAQAAARNAGHAADQAFSRLREEVTGGAPRTDYRLTRYAAYLVAMNGDPRKTEIAQAQTYFAIKTREAETTQAASTATPAFVLPATYAEALRELAATVEQRDAVRAELAVAQPAADAWNTLATATGDFSVADAAKILSRDPAIKLGRDRLFTLLAEWKWTFRQQIDSRWRPMQTAVESGRLSEMPSTHYHPRTGELINDAPQVRVTFKGLADLHHRLGGTAQLQLPAVAA